MKRKVFGLAVLIFVFVFSLTFVSAKLLRCDLSGEILNQDPYPAVPGEYVKVVLQVTGLGNPQCGKASFEIVEEFPFSLNPGTSNIIEVAGGTYLRDFNSTFLIPLELKVDENAVDGDNELEVIFKYEQANGESLTETKTFDINVEEVSTDFEVSINDYDAATNTLTFEIINVGKNNIEALTVDIPKQESVVVKGTNREIIGDLDSNEDTSFKFEAIPKDGEINLIILYNDEVNVRHSLNKKVVYDSSYFTDRKKDQTTSYGIYYFLAIVIIAIALWIYLRRRKKKKLIDFQNSGKRK